MPSFADALSSESHQDHENIRLGHDPCLGYGQTVRGEVLQASTSEIYGDPDVRYPQPESYRGLVNTLGPRACYDEGKRAAEALCSDYRRSHDVEVRIARIFNTYGPGMDDNDGRVVSNFIMQTLCRENPNDVRRRVHKPDRSIATETI